MAEKILIVDDDMDTVRMVGLMLERQGYQIVAAGSGAQALNLAKVEKPNLILLDLMMPDIDGVQVARQLRADPETEKIMIIMFTARTETEDKIKGFDAGADDYLTKPTQPRELIAHVKAVLNRAPKKTPPAEITTEEGKVVGVLAAKGGVGVSTIAMNVGIALQRQYRKNVIVADFRPGRGTIGLELGIPNSQGFNRLLRRKSADISIHDVDTELTELFSGMRFLLSSPLPQDARYVIPLENFTVVADHLAHLAQVAVLDLGVAITPVNDKVIWACDQIILVLEPVAQTVLQTRALIEYLIEKDFGDDRVLIALVNRVRAGVQLSLSQVQDQLGRSVSVIFTANPELAYQACADNTPMIIKQPDGITTQQFVSLAEKLVKRL